MFTTISVLGVVLGVMALTVVLAVTTGMQREFREKVLGVNAHIIVQKNTADFKEYREIEQVILAADERVVAVQPFNFVDMVATRGLGEVSSVAVKGVDPERIDRAAHADQAALIARHGGRDAVIARGGFGASPVPGEAAEYVALDDPR